jgi:Tfp pilus assembly protein PilV
MGRSRKRRRGFTLLEVTVAFTIFFIAVFAILELTTNSLSAARSLRQREPDTGLVAAMLSLTNKIVEGVESGDFEDLYADVYPGWHWEAHLTEAISAEGMVLTNLFQADIIVYRRSGRGPSVSTLSLYLYRPESPPGAGRSAF